MARIRCATEADASALLDMGRAMHAESPRYAARRWDDVKVRAAIDAFISPANDGRALLLVAERADVVVGMAAVFAAEDWFGPDRFVTDRVVYVRPEHRGSSVFHRLVAAVEAWARAIGVQDIEIGVTTGVRVEQTVCAYQRLAYTLRDTRVVTKTLDHVHRT